MQFQKEAFDQMPIVGILRGISSEALDAILPAYLEAGLTTLEITMNTAGFSEMMTAATAQYGEQLNIGAGTVCTETDLEVALQAGAQFIVTPILNEQVVKRCVERDIPVFPGALTPSEIYRAWTWGATMVKVFPASAFGPSYIKEVRAPLNEVQLLPTGGVSLENMADYHRAGAVGFGLGSLLFDKRLIETKQWPALRQKMQAVADHCRKIRQ
jgi:2-dehydro-3-deoxyphosphogluconate aldolase/(4S)-4-hydroxy-2-oxoglutarate aldolase